jgi:hypothetical protein
MNFTTQRRVRKRHRSHKECISDNKILVSPISECFIQALIFLTCITDMFTLNRSLPDEEKRCASMCLQEKVSWNRQVKPVHTDNIKMVG